jgi:hypothetical protein
MEHGAAIRLARRTCDEAAPPRRGVRTAILVEEFARRSAAPKRAGVLTRMRTSKPRRPAVQRLWLSTLRKLGDERNPSRRQNPVLRCLREDAHRARTSWSTAQPIRPPSSQSGEPIPDIIAHRPDGRCVIRPHTTHTLTSLSYYRQQSRAWQDIVYLCIAVIWSTYVQAKLKEAAQVYAGAGDRCQIQCTRFVASVA